MSDCVEKRCGAGSARKKRRFRNFLPLSIFRGPGADLHYSSSRFTILTLFCLFISVIPSCSRKFSPILAFSHINYSARALISGGAQVSGSHHGAGSTSPVAGKRASFARITVFMERSLIPFLFSQRLAALRELIPFFCGNSPTAQNDSRR